MPEPKVIEVSEEEYLRNKRVFDTVSRMAKNPKSAKLLEQANKEVNPEAPTPLADSEKKVTEPFEALNKKLDDFIKTQSENSEKSAKEAKDAEFKKKWEAGQRALKENRWTDEGIKALEDFMAKHGIVDHDIGVAAFEKINPPPAPAVPVNTGSWDFMEQGDSPDKEIQKLVETIGARGNPDGIVDKMARNALAQARQPNGIRR